MPLAAISAQETATPVSCAGQPISDIVINSEAPSVRVLQRWRWLERLANQIHTVTRPDVIRRFLVIEVGQPCSEIRRAESERILRAQQFIADARITPFPDGSGGVFLEVATTDEVSLIIGGSFKSSSPYVHGVKLGNANLNGEALYVAAEWRQGNINHDDFAARFVDYQLLGRPYQLTAEGSRRDLGSSWLLEARHPFFTDLQRVAWRTTRGESHDYLTFQRPTGDDPSLSVARGFVDVGAVVRIGLPGRLSLFGASLTWERERPGAEPVLISDTAVTPDTSTVLIGRYEHHQTARVNALWGVRNVRFLRVQGFDALRGVQDVRRGFQLGTLFGRGISAIGAHDDDIFVAADLYAGFGSAKAFAALQLIGEGRQNNDRNSWDGILSTGRGASYFRLHDRHTLILDTEWSGGWRQRVPFQLTLGDDEGGVRGFGGSRLAGGRRLVARAEERWYLGRPFGLSDLGVAIYADAGKLWAGDAPFGTTTGATTGVGFGILGAVPPRSRRTWRVDIAFPVTKDPDAKWEVRATMRDFTRNFWREPRDVRRSRERSVPTSIFSWP
jgi:hypothetical protein